MPSKRLQEKLHEAVMLGKIEEVKKCIKNGADVNYIGEYGAPLETVSWYSYYDLAVLLIESGASININHGAPLKNAVLTLNRYSPDLVRLYVEKGADINHKYNLESDLKGATLIMGAIQHGFVDRAYLLLELGADPTIKSKNGWTAFTWCALNNFKKLASAMIEKSYTIPFFDEDDKNFFDKIKNGQNLHDNYLEESYEMKFAHDQITPHYTGNPDLSKVWVGGSLPHCNNPPIHLLTLDLSKLEMFPEEIRNAGLIHVVYGNCQGCDEPDFLDLKVMPDCRVSLIEETGDEDESEDESEEAASVQEDEVDGGEDYDDGDQETENIPTCEPDDYTPSPKITYLKISEDEDSFSEPVTLGGLPPWLQYPQWVGCPECGISSYYIGYINQFEVPPGAEGPGNFIYIFLCPEHKIISLVKQMT